MWGEGDDPLGKKSSPARRGKPGPQKKNKPGNSSKRKGKKTCTCYSPSPKRGALLRGKKKKGGGSGSTKIGQTACNGKHKMPPEENSKKECRLSTGKRVGPFSKKKVPHSLRRRGPVPKDQRDGAWGGETVHLGGGPTVKLKGGGKSRELTSVGGREAPEAILPEYGWKGPRALEKGKEPGGEHPLMKLL